MTTQPQPRTPNLALRRVRQSMRLSQAQFADAIRAAGNAMGAPNHCTKRLVQKWETGEHAACRPDYLRVLQAVTGLSARELGFRLVPDESGLSVTASDDRVDEAARDPSEAVATLALTEYSTDTAPNASIARLHYALEHPSTVELGTTDLVRTATSRLFDLEHHSPPQLLAPTVDRHLARVTALLTAARHEKVRRSLMASAGHSALLAGWLAFDRGDNASAHRFWDAAIGAAEATLDVGLMAATLTYQAYAAARRGDPGTAWQLAHTASSHTHDDPRATAWTTSRVALHAAQLGEGDAARSAMKHALEIGENLPNPTPGDGGAPWTRSFDHSRLLASAAHTAARLKDPNAADYATRAVDALDSAKVKAHAMVLAETALTAAIVGEFELCLNYGSQAAAITRELDVSTAADLLHEIIPIILPYSDTRHVRALLPQLSRLTRTADREDEADANEQDDNG